MGTQGCGGGGGRTKTLKGLRGPDWGVRRVPTPRFPRGLQNSGSPYVDPRAPASWGSRDHSDEAVLPIHSSIHPHACLFLPPRPQVPRASVSPSAPGCGHAHLTFRMRDPGGVGGGGDVGGRPGEAEPARVCEPTRLGVRALIGGATGSELGDPGPAVLFRADARRLRCRCDSGQPSPLPRAGLELRRGTYPSPPAGDPSSATARSPQSPPGYPPNPRMVQSTITSMFIL